MAEPLRIKQVSDAELECIQCGRRYQAGVTSSRLDPDYCSRECQTTWWDEPCDDGLLGNDVYDDEP